MADLVLDEVTAGATLIMPLIVESILTGTVTPTVTENGLQVQRGKDKTTRGYSFKYLEEIDD